MRVALNFELPQKLHEYNLRKTIPARREPVFGLDPENADSTTVRQGEATPLGRFCVSPDEETYSKHPVTLCYNKLLPLPYNAL